MSMCYKNAVCFVILKIVIIIIIIIIIIVLSCDLIQQNVLFSDLLYFAWAHQRHCQCCICHTAPEGGTFDACDTFYAPT